MTELALEVIRPCFEGVVPAILATCDSEGVPNVSLISQVHFVDPERIALSYQFFNKTRRNILETRHASAVVVDPITVAQFTLDLEYEETQTVGPLFESMKAKLAGIASHTGMSSVFRLLGADVFKVRSIERVERPVLIRPQAARNLLSAARCTCAQIANAAELGDMLDKLLFCLDRHFGIEHAMVLMLDPTSGRLYTVASRGYEQSGIGSEVALGEGVIGVAARERVPIRIGHMTSEYRYGDAIRDSATRAGMTFDRMTEIPFPGLEAPQSQIALPLLSAGQTLGVLFAESQEMMRFWYDDEDALALVADRAGSLLGQIQQDAPPANEETSEPVETGDGRFITIRRYPADNSVFLDHDYLIKGVAGAIFWKLVTEYVQNGRNEFTNRELRLDPGLRLPEHAENLEARLLLLQRRLSERDARIQIEKCGRGRFRLVSNCRLGLENMSPGARSASAV